MGGTVGVSVGVVRVDVLVGVLVGSSLVGRMMGVSVGPGARRACAGSTSLSERRRRSSAGSEGS